MSGDMFMSMMVFGALLLSIAINLVMYHFMKKCDERIEENNRQHAIEKVRWCWKDAHKALGDYAERMRPAGVALARECKNFHDKAMSEVVYGQDLNKAIVRNLTTEWENLSKSLKTRRFSGYPAEAWNGLDAKLIDELAHAVTEAFGTMEGLLKD